MRGRLVVLVLQLSVAMSGCGDDGAPEAPANQAPTAVAGVPRSALVGATISLDASASTDPEHDALGFRWALTTRPEGSTAALTAAATATPGLIGDVAGTYVATLVVSDGRLTSAPSTVVVTVHPTDGLTIVADQPEAVSGTVQLSLSGPTPGAGVSWFVDSRPIGAGASLPWNTQSEQQELGNGPHRIVARLQVTTDRTVEIQRSIVIFNSSISVTSTVDAFNGNVDVRASSPVGISGVSASLDGRSLGTLAEPNVCTSTCSVYMPRKNTYQFHFDPVSAGSGNHLLVVTAVDRAGTTRPINLPVLVSNAPVLTIAGPADGQLVHGILRLSGSQRSDKPDVVTVTASLDGTEFLRTTDRTFEATYDLTSLPTGSHELFVAASDTSDRLTGISRRVIVASAPELAYRPLRALGSNGRLLAAAGDLLLYRTMDRDVRLQDTVTGTEVILQGSAAMVYDNDWQISGGRVFAPGQGDDCAYTGCIYRWEGDGTRTNLTTANPWAENRPQFGPVAKDGVVAWCNGATDGHYTIYSVGPGTYRHVVVPPGALFAGADLDVAVADGVVHFFYSAATGPGNERQFLDVFRWTSVDGLSTRVSTPGSASQTVRTDGVRLAWREFVPGARLDGVSALVVTPLAGGVPLRMSASATSYRMRDGVLAWAESSGSDRAVKASTMATGVHSLSSVQSATLYDTRDGIVLFGENDRTFGWNATTGRTTLRLDAPLGEFVVGDGTLYFTSGATRLLYKLRVN